MRDPDDEAAFPLPAMLAVALVVLLCAAGVGVWLLQGTGRPTCVAAGTLVATPSGPRAIEDLAPGDPVWCSDLEGARAAGRIVETRSADAQSILALTLSDQRALEVTGEHPICTPRGWVEAARLQVGDTVHTDGGPRRLTAKVERAGLRSVHDLTVTPHANFFAAGVLVHNKSPIPPPGLERRAAAEWLRRVRAAQEAYKTRDLDRDGKQRYGDLEDLLRAVPPEDLGREGYSGYRFEVWASRSEPDRRWFATARPPGHLRGEPHMVTNQDGAIFFTTTPVPRDDTDCAIPAGAVPSKAWPR